MHAVLNSRGLYNTFQFVLRLSPEVHRKIEAVPNGIQGAEQALPSPRIAPTMEPIVNRGRTPMDCMHYPSTWDHLMGLASLTQRSKAAPGRQGFDSIGGSRRDRLDGQRRIYGARCRKDRAVADDEVGHIVRSTIGIDH